MEGSVVVSIVCNVYNHERYLRDALEGFVTQKTAFPFEVLIHDDASTDKSTDIIREYEEKYPDIIRPIYQTQNRYSQGIPITSTYQIPRIQGQYVAVCEGDDYWIDPLKLQKQVDFLDNHPEYTMCATSVRWLDMRTNTEACLCKTSQDRDVTLEEIILEKKGRVFQSATIMVKRDVFCHRPDWTKRFGVGDTPLAIYAAISGKVRMIADITAVYRNHADGSWTSRISENVQYKIKAFQKMIDGLTFFNEETAFKYDELVCRRILQIQYNIARANRDLKQMRSGELKKVYLSRPLKSRMADVLCCKTPRLHAFLLRHLR